MKALLKARIPRTRLALSTSKARLKGQPLSLTDFHRALLAMSQGYQSRRTLSGLLAKTISKAEDGIGEVFPLARNSGRRELVLMFLFFPFVLQKRSKWWNLKLRVPHRAIRPMVYSKAYTTPTTILQPR